MSFTAKRTYSSKRNRTTAFPPSSPISTFSSSPTPTAATRDDEAPSSKRAKKDIPKSKSKASTQKKLTQLHFCIDQPIVRCCPLCELTYTKGAEEDENLHRAHCARVQKSMDWGRGETREAEKAGVEEVASGVHLRGGGKGKIVCMRASVGGKIGAKLATIMDVVNLTLSSPPLQSKVLQDSKIYIFLASTSSSSATTRYKVVGCAVAQRIISAMAIASSEEPKGAGRTIVSLDTGLFCYPEPLPTPLGIARLYVAKDHRRRGIATQLLDTVAKTFIEGCVLDPKKGQVAFTQTTGEGQAIMRSWGGGRVRIYEE